MPRSGSVLCRIHNSIAFAQHDEGGLTRCALTPAKTHVSRSNASSLWLGMRPADIFVFVFLPPFLVDLAVRIDYFMLKKARHL